MATYTHLLLFLSLALAITAQHVHFQIPYVETKVKSITSKYHQFLTYHGPTGTATAALHHTHTHRPFPTKTPSTCDYWYEDIKHQGISAFNADPAEYHVYRNVKDLGAKGQSAEDLFLNLS